MAHRALVVGSTGIVGQTLAQRLVAAGWVVYGVARKPQSDVSGIISLAVDLLQKDALQQTLSTIQPPYFFLHMDPLRHGA